MAGTSGIVKTSLDTNILVTLWQGQPGALALTDLLLKLQLDGPMVVCAPVWVELCGLPGLRPSEVSRLLGELDVEVEFEIRQMVWERAATAYAAYTRRRREAGGGVPRRLMADFVIGAHGVTACHRLVTADSAFYRRCFPQLKVVPPPD